MTRLPMPRICTLILAFAAVATTLHADVDTGTYTYGQTLPTVTGDTFTESTIPIWVTDPERFQGTIWLTNITTVTDFTVNTYGNESSKVKLTNISGWLRAPDNYAFTNTVPVEIAGTLTLNNGNSANNDNPNRCTVFKKVSGSGTVDTTADAARVVVVIQDSTEFTGSLGLNKGKYVVFGKAMPGYTTITNTTVGSIFVMSDAKVTNSGFWWATGGMQVYGELRASGLDKFGGGTYITTSDTGTFTLTAEGGIRQFDVDYSRIKGTGTLRLEGEKWFTLPTNKTISTSLTLGLARTQGVVIPPGGVTIGNISGSGNLRSDLEAVQGGTATMRNLSIEQSKDTEWRGIFREGDRIDTVYVKPGENAGTLTLSGAQTHNNKLVVEAGAKVNITGTWVGATTVAGTIGGTGTITGDLALSNGATIQVDNISATALTVSDNITVGGTIRVNLPANADTDRLIKLVGKTTKAKPDISSATFEVYVGDALSPRARVVSKTTGLYATSRGARIILR